MFHCALPSSKEEINRLSESLEWEEAVEITVETGPESPETYPDSQSTETKKFAKKKKKESWLKYFKNQNTTIIRKTSQRVNWTSMKLLFQG